MLTFALIGLVLLVSSRGAAHYADVDAAAAWPSGAGLVISVSAIVLTAWWPHPKHIQPA